MFYKSLKNHAQQFLNGYQKENPATYAAAQQAIGGLLIVDGFTGIDNPLGGRKRSGIFGSLLGILFGLVFIFGTGIVANLFGINKMTAVTQAQVVEVGPRQVERNSDGSTSGGTCSLKSKYTVNGKEYTQVSSIDSDSNCSLSQGQTISVNYDPNNPGKYVYDLGSVKAVMKIFSIVGIIFVVVSFFTFLIRLISIIFGWKLLKSGRALAKTLPAGTDIGTIKDEIKGNFAKSIFGTENNKTNTPTSTPTQPSAKQ